MSSTKPSAGVSQEDEVKRAADLREWLESRILELEDELNKHKEMLAIVDSVLRKTSFVPATELRNQQETGVAAARVTPQNKSSVEKESANISSPKSTSKVDASAKATKSSTVAQPQYSAPLQSEAGNAAESRSLRRSKDGMLLASALISPDSIIIVPASDVKLPQTTPPFQSFFINRILKGYESKDVEMSQAGNIQASEVLKYEVTESDGHIERVIVRNYRDKSRLNEILNTLSWAFSRMLEKK